MFPLKKSKTVCAALLLLGGCVMPPQMDPAYVSPVQYHGYTCEQISAEMQRVSQRIGIAAQANGTTQALNAAVDIFAISQGAVRARYGDSQRGQAEIELRRLRNQYDVLDQVAIQKGCVPVQAPYRY